MRLDDGADNRQAQTAAARLAGSGGFAAVEALEELRDLRSLDLGARVLNPQTNLGIQTFDFDPNLARSWCVTCGVLEQVVQHLPEPFGIGQHQHRAVRVELHRDLIGLEPRPKILERTPRQLAQVEAARHQVQAARIRQGQGLQVVGQQGKHVDLTVQLADLVAFERVDALLKSGDPHPQGCQRRAQLVRNRGARGATFGIVMLEAFGHPVDVLDQQREFAGAADGRGSGAQVATGEALRSLGQVLEWPNEPP